MTYIYHNGNQEPTTQTGGFAKLLAELQSGDCMVVERLSGAAVRCTDLRGGAALCVAALSADGESRIFETSHIDRGYEDIAGDLRALGADAVRVDNE